MKKFMDKDFLLETETAKKLFHDFAENMPIFDYHCHVNVSEILENKSYANITELWLSGDHYKWRAMRLFGIDEEYITGNKSDYEKFEKYAEMIESAIGNPLYHWTHLELQRFFDIHETLSKKTAKSIFEKANQKLKSGLTTRKLIQLSKVKKICSTDDPIDDLKSHFALKKEAFEVEVLPTFRPDKGLEINAESFLPWLKKLETVVGYALTTYEQFLQALEDRLAYFEKAGCKLSDHSLSAIPFALTDLKEVSQIYTAAIQGEKIDELSETKYKFFTLKNLANSYHKRKFTMQIHIGALRANNSKMHKKLGADTGFDSIDDKNIAYGLSKFLDACNENGLPKTILYTLNPKDNYVLGTMMGNFVSSEVATKVQFGTAWWFNDQRDGMTEQIKAFGNLGLLSKFVGMLTDSRSFSSYVRHEYFRRILCNLLGTIVENGEFEQNYDVLGKIVQDICYNNIVKYFEA